MANSSNGKTRKKTAKKKSAPKESTKKAEGNSNDLYAGSRQQLAALFGSTDRTFHRSLALRNGEPPERIDGKGYSLIDWIAYVRKDDRAKTLTEVRRNRVKDDPDAEGDSKPLTPTEMKRFFEVQKLQLDLEERRGTLIPREHVDMAWGLLAANMKACSKSMAKRYPEAKKLLDQTLIEMEREFRTRFES